ncbi:MAG TPA: hypothetical protein VGC29_05290, partial [Flavisolibacter sp.]
HGYISRLDELNKAAESFSAREVIFCPGELSYKEIIAQLKQLDGKLKARFYAGDSIVGSDDRTSRGEILSTEAGYRLSMPGNRRIKRLMDVAVSILLLLFFPFVFFLVEKPLGLVKNCIAVLTGKMTWIGYTTPSPFLPRLRTGVFGSNGHLPVQDEGLPGESLQLVDRWYAMDYEPLQDLRLILKNFKYLGG